MSLVTVQEAQALVQSSLSDVDLQKVITRLEAEITAIAGPPFDAVSPLTITENLRGWGGSLFTKRPIYSIAAITEYAAITDTVGTLLATDQYHAWLDEGQLVRPGKWGARVTVTYIPQDDTPKRKQVIIDLLRLTISRQALAEEWVGNEYKYTAPDWEKEKWKIIRKLIHVTY